MEDNSLSYPRVLHSDPEYILLLRSYAWSWQDIEQQRATVNGAKHEGLEEAERVMLQEKGNNALLGMTDDTDSDGGMHPHPHPTSGGSEKARRLQAYAEAGMSQRKFNLASTIVDFSDGFNPAAARRGLQLVIGGSSSIVLFSSNPSPPHLHTTSFSSPINTQLCHLLSTWKIVVLGRKDAHEMCCT